MRSTLVTFSRDMRLTNQRMAGEAHRYQRFPCRLGLATGARFARVGITKTTQIAFTHKSKGL